MAVHVKPCAARSWRGVVLTGAAGTLSLVLAACGSQLEPGDLVSAGALPGGAVAPGTVPGTVADGSVPGTTGSTGTGTTGSSGTTGLTGTGTTGSSGSSGTTGTTGSGPTSTGSKGAAAPVAGGDNAAAGGEKGASCDGFTAGTGITDTEITLANVSDISGPVPGIFESSQDGARAYAAYFNSTSDICGRKLKMLLLDSRADAGADQQSYTVACEQSFAAVGSMSAFDSGGAATAQACGLPDIRSTSVNPERNACSTCFSAQSLSPTLIPRAPSDFFTKNYKDATQAAAFLYINAGAAPLNSLATAKAHERNGWKELYVQGIDVSEFNYAPYVQQMKDKGVRLVQYQGPYQNTVKLLQAMDQQGFKPDVVLQDATIYDSRFVEQAGSLGEGVFTFTTTDLFTNNGNAEMALYNSWLQQVNPGATPTFFGLYSWSATRLFVEEAVKLGGKLDRATLVAAMKNVHKWTSNGLHTEQDVAAKQTAPCMRMLQLSGGGWKQVSPGAYQCGAMTSGS